MKEITIGDKSLMQISKEDILQLAVMQGCCAHLDFWNYPTLLEYDNTMFSDTVVISYKSTRKEDGIESIPLVFFFCVSDLSYHYHRENVTEKWYGERYMDIEEITAGRKKAILMDNNILASNYGLQQIEKIIKLGIKVDFNQGLDARLITDEIARLLAKVKWIKRIRFGCDTPGQIAEVERASALIDKYGYKGEYFLYCILMDFEESFARVNYWKSKSRRFLPHCQPFRDLNNPHQIIPQWQKDMAHWADRKEIYMSCDFKDFSPRKGFLCKEYFKIL